MKECMRFNRGFVGVWPSSEGPEFGSDLTVVELILIDL